MLDEDLNKQKGGISIQDIDTVILLYQYSLYTEYVIKATTDRLKQRQTAHIFFFQPSACLSLIALIHIECICLFTTPIARPFLLL